MLLYPSTATEKYQNTIMLLFHTSERSSSEDILISKRTGFDLLLTVRPVTKYIACELFLNPAILIHKMRFVSRALYTQRRSTPSQCHRYYLPRWHILLSRRLFSSRYWDSATAVLFIAGLILSDLLEIIRSIASFLGAPGRPMFKETL